MRNLTLETPRRNYNIFFSNSLITLPPTRFVFLSCVSLDLERRSLDWVSLPSWPLVSLCFRIGCSWPTRHEWRCIVSKIKVIPYRTKIRRTKLSKFRLGVESFFRRNILSVENLSNILIQKSGKNRIKVSKFRLGVENFVRRNILSVENFVRRNFVR